MNLFISPHNDDEALFGSFIILGEQPRTLVVFDSVVQVSRGNLECSAEARRAETCAALEVLSPGISPVFLGIPDQGPPSQLAAEVSKAFEALAQAMDRQDGWPHVGSDAPPGAIWLPAAERGGHPQHNMVGELGAQILSAWPLRFYATYTPAGRSTTDHRVFIQPGWARKKLLALACYRSQLDLVSTQPHFLRDLNEYVV